MSFLSRVKSAPGHLMKVDTRHKSGLVSHAVETGESLGAAYLSARINTQYGEKAKWRGVELTYAGGLGLKLAAILADILGYGGGWSAHANSIGMGALAAHFAAKGAQDGAAAAAGLVSTPSLPGKTVVGQIPEAPLPGKFLDWGKIERLAAMHG